uniref:ribosomal protein S11 n=1 Tax=Fushitsunagia catenata TaxID=1827018 RepID=UPI0026E3E0C4|nr:ribosomal protein S11 [Fushitsunagia catenata]WJJ67927.1 ribosomal protein S11 [Fushitsunagia catenata]
MFNPKSLILSVLFTSNNVLFTLTNLHGDVFYWTSTGSYKQKGVKKLTSTSLSLAVKIILQQLKHLKYNFVHLKLKGFKKNKKIILRHFKTSNLNILSVSDFTSLPHNGCKNKKPRRL